MKKINLIFDVLILVSLFFIAGCGSDSDSEYTDDVGITNSRLVEGAFSAETSSGMKIESSKGTFYDEKTEITVKEVPFSGVGSSMLANADKCYELYGVIKSDNPFAAGTEITDVEKPLTVVLPNTIKNSDKASSVRAYYVGIKNNPLDSWRFVRIDDGNSKNNPQVISSVRASLDSSEFYFNVYKLGIQFALFADIGDGKLLSAASIDSVSSSIKGASNGAEEGKVRVKENLYAEDMKVTVNIHGKNVESLNSNDVQLVLTYFSESGNNISGLGGTGSYCETPSQSSGSSKKYVHKVTLKNYNYDGEHITFVLKTKGVSVDEFPIDFSFDIKSSGLNSYLPVLPFDYSNQIAVETSDKPVTDDPTPVPGPTPDEDAPAAPVNLIASSEKIRFGEPVTLTWEPGDDTDVKYNVYLASDSVAALVAEELSDESWSSSLLSIGNYSASVVAKNSKGNISAPAKTKFTVVDGTLLPVTVADARESYKFGEDIRFAWTAVEDPMENSVVYEIVLLGEDGSEKIATSTSDTEFIFKELEKGNFKVQITVTNGIDSSAPYVHEFVVVESILESPVLHELASVVGYGQQLTISWEPVTDSDGKKVLYDLWVWAQNEQFSVERPKRASYSGSAAEFSLNNLAVGIYSVVVSATNGEERSADSEIKTFAVRSPVAASININETSVCAGGFYTVQPAFEVTVGAGNCAEEVIKAAVIIKDITVPSTPVTVDESLLVKNWNVTDGVLTISMATGEKLEKSHNYSVVMNQIQDLYDSDVKVFEEHKFTTAPFEGRGYSEDPYILDCSPQASLCSGSGEAAKMALVSGVTANVETVKSALDGVSFGNGVTAYGYDVTFDSATISGNNLLVDMSENSIWPADSQVTFGLNFNAVYEGKAVYFKTGENTLSTESGNDISVGDGSEGNPYLIYTNGQLDKVRGNLDKCFRQMRDLDLEGYVSDSCNEENGWLPIGEETVPFTGCYDGNNKSIANLRIVRSDKMGVGLFGFAVGDSMPVKIQNLTLTDCFVDIPDTGFIDEPDSVMPTFGGCTNFYGCGSLVGCCANATISNCHTTGVVVGFGPLTSGTGGLIGYSESCNVQKSTTGDMNISDSMTVWGRASCGGLIGRCSSTFVSNCNSNSTIKITEEGQSAGGLIGYLCSYGDSEEAYKINDCMSKGSVTGGSIVGGLVGDNECCSIESCRSESSIAGKDYVGGLVGRISFFGWNINKVQDCIAKGDVKGNGYVGGLIGYAGGNYSDWKLSCIANCFANMDSIIANSYSGGLVGYNNRCLILASNAKFDTLSSDGEEGYASSIGGLVGYEEYGHVFGCYAEFNTIEAKRPLSDYDDGVGGLIGVVSEAVCVYNSYAKGNIQYDGRYAGGLIGNNNSDQLKNCYADVSISDGIDNKGGLLGYNSGSAVSCFSTKAGELAASGRTSEDDLIDCRILEEGYTDTPEWREHWTETIWDLQPLPLLREGFPFNPDEDIYQEPA